MDWKSGGRAKNKQNFKSKNLGFSNIKKYFFKLQKEQIPLPDPIIFNLQKGQLPPSSMRNPHNVFGVTKLTLTIVSASMNRISKLSGYLTKISRFSIRYSECSSNCEAKNHRIISLDIAENPAGFSNF